MGKKVSLEEFLSLTERYKNWKKWGPDDEFGTLNYISTDEIISGAKEVKSGRVFSLAIPFDSNGPQTGGFGRFNPIHMMIRDGGDVLSGALLEFYHGEKQIRGTDDMVIMPLQCATQWDSLAHIIHGGRMYNGYDANTVSSFGAKRNSIDKVRDKIVGRGVLVDVPKSQGREWLEPGEGISSKDLERAVHDEGVEMRKGDVVLLRTGQMGSVKASGKWGNYAGGPAPGLSLDCLDWVSQNKIAAIASDTWGVEVLPNETPEVFQPFHIVAVVYMGLLLGEIFDLETLAKDCASDGKYSFFFSALPLPITGAVGSPVNPMVVK